MLNQKKRDLKVAFCNRLYKCLLNDPIVDFMNESRADNL